MGKQGGIFQAWLKNFMVIVFLQTFQAIFLSFIIQIVGGITSAMGSVSVSDSGDKEGMLAIVAMVSIMSLIKMEKMIKSIFGIEDSKFLGGVGDNFAKTMAGMKSAVNMAQRTAEPIKDVKSSRDRIRKARAGQERATNTINSIGGGSSTKNVAIGGGGSGGGNPATLSFKAGELYAKALDAKKAGDMDGYRKYMQDAAANLRNERLAGGSNSSAPRANDDMDKETKAKLSAAKKSLAENKIEEELARADMKNAAIKTFTRAGSTVASLAFGMGATDNLADAATLANLVDMPLDAASDRFAAKQAYGTSGKKLEKQLEEARSEAVKKIKKEFPELKEDSVEFQAKVNVAVSTEMDAKLAVDSKIPQSAFKQAAQVWKEAGTSMSREARRYANDVSKNGVVYGNTNIDDI